MKSTAPSAYSPAPAAWCQSWLFTNEHAPTMDIPVHANPANRIPSTATTIIFRNLLPFLVYLKYTLNFTKSQEKYFLDEIRLNFFVKNFTSNRSSKFFVKSFTIFGTTSSKFFVKFFTNFSEKKGGNPPFYA